MLKLLKSLKAKTGARPKKQNDFFVTSNSPSNEPEYVDIQNKSWQILFLCTDQFSYGLCMCVGASLPYLEASGPIFCR